jgi:AraC-like DNA-binding protein
MKQEFFAAPPSAVSPPIHERHYTVQEIAEAWNMSENLVRRLFEKEPGVVIFKKDRPHKRTYKTIRIPESVLLRVHRRNSVLN